MTSEEDKKYGERLAVVEEKLDNLVSGFDRLNNNFETFTTRFVPKSELDLMFDSRDKQIDYIKDNLNEIEQNKWSIRRLWPAWIAVLISLFSWLFNK